HERVGFQNRHFGARRWRAATLHPIDGFPELPSGRQNRRVKATPLRLDLARLDAPVHDAESPRIQHVRGPDRKTCASPDSFELHRRMRRAARWWSFAPRRHPLVFLPKTICYELTNSAYRVVCTLPVR